jgi:hypothetical protein
MTNEPKYKTPLKKRLKLAWYALTGNDQMYQMWCEERRRAEAYEALSVTAYDTLVQMSRMPHNGRKARAAALFIKTQADSSDLNLQGF